MTIRPLTLPMLGVGFLLASALVLSACGSDKPDTAPEVEPNPLIFEITNTQGETEGWMLGTIHALPKGTEWRTPVINDVIDEADLLIVEVANLSDRQEIAQIFTTLSTSPGLPELWQRIGSEHRPALDKMLDSSNFSMSDFDETETWAAALTLAQLSAQGDPAYGVDRAVIADFKDRTIIEFEGAQDQLNIFDTLAEEDQRALLEGVIAETNEASDQQARLRNAWLTGEASILEETTKTGIMTDPELREALLVERNEDWADTLSALLKDPERPLVAVGAAHLVGPESLPALLEQEGYTIEAMIQ